MQVVFAAGKERHPQGRAGWTGQTARTALAIAALPSMMTSFGVALTSRERRNASQSACVAWWLAYSAHTRPRRAPAG